MELFHNIYLWAAVISWLLAEIVKILIHLAVEHKFRPSLLFSSGGMPSSHAAVVCALCSTMAFADPQQMGSPAFAICCVFAYVVMYDAAGVRRAAGEQAKVLNRMQAADAKNPGQQLKELVGHTPFQVFCGAVLGIVVGFLTAWISGAWAPYAA